MKRSSFLNMVMQRKKMLIKPKRKVPPKWLFPSSAEKHYDKIMRSLTSELKKLIKEILIPEIPSMIQEANENTPNDRNDAFIERLNKLILFIRGSINPKVESTIVGSKIIGAEISAFNKSQFEKMTHSVFGIDLFVDEPWLSDQLSLFSSQNAHLITSIPNQELERVAGEIERGLQQGSRFSDVAKSIQKSFGITDRRARLIARDQTSKLNASLTRLRQEEVGVTSYTWQTSGDERVRPTHKANDGKVFKWDKPSPITGHPGHDVNCRCVAIPVLDNLLNFG